MHTFRNTSMFFYAVWRHCNDPGSFRKKFRQDKEQHIEKKKKGLNTLKINIYLVNSELWSFGGIKVLILLIFSEAFIAEPQNNWNCPYVICKINIPLHANSVFTLNVPGHWIGKIDEIPFYIHSCEKLITS